MGFVSVSGLRHSVGGRLLFEDVNFRVGEGAKVAVVGANGTGKTTLLRIIAGDMAPEAGSVAHAGGLAMMRQFIAESGDSLTVGELLLRLAGEELQGPGHALQLSEEAIAVAPRDEGAAIQYAQAVADWADAGGYDTEVVWDVCTTVALGEPFDVARRRPLAALSGGQQKRLALEALLRGSHDVLLLDEPDNFLDVAGKRWLEQMIRDSTKTILFVSHDRELLANTATHIVTLEGRSAWVHGGGFRDYPEARRARLDRLDELHRRWREEHEHLVGLVRRLRVHATMSDAMASRYQATVTRLRKFEEVGPPVERPREQDVRVRLRGGRTGVRVVRCEGLALTGLTAPFSLEIFFGDRVALLGANGTGKTQLLRLFAGEPVPHSGEWRLGARVIAGWFRQTHDRPELHPMRLVDILWKHGLDRADAMRALTRYELDEQAAQEFSMLSGGQQARFQILLLELGGATLLLLDEPTDNLDLHSAEALERALDSYQGTVVTVTHDRWFTRTFDRFILIDTDGGVREVPEPVWDEPKRDSLEHV